MGCNNATSQVLVRQESHLDAVFARCVGAYSDFTLRGYRCDLNIFAAWCTDKGAEIIPASPDIVAAFIDEQTVDYSYATIRRRVSAIKFLHRMCDLPSPIDTSVVYLSLRRAARTKGRRPKQVRGLTAEILTLILDACPQTLAGLRDAAIVSVGYDTLCRSSELAWMKADQLDLASQTVYIPRSKNDPFADGRIAHLSSATVEKVNQWLRASDIKDGPLFRGLVAGKLHQGHMETSSVRRLVKASAWRAGLDQDIVAGLSGHSMRVGAAQDLITAGYDTVAIMTAGGWKNVEVVARYVEKAALRVRTSRVQNDSASYQSAKELSRIGGNSDVQLSSCGKETDERKVV